MSCTLVDSGTFPIGAFERISKLVFSVVYLPGRTTGEINDTVTMVESCSDRPL